MTMTKLNPIFEGFNHMPYQIRNPKGFARMLEMIIEIDRLPELAFCKNASAKWKLNTQGK